MMPGLNITVNEYDSLEITAISIASGAAATAAAALAIAGRNIFDQVGRIGPDLLDDLIEKVGGDALEDDYDPDNTSNSIQVHWNNVIFPPVYKNRGDERIGFGSNVYIEKNSKIYGIDKLELLQYDGGKYKRISTNLVSDDLIYDFSNKEMYLNKINCALCIHTSNSPHQI
jgi:hypothetical protein